MKTLTIITGAARSGKSLLAERLATGITGDPLIGSHRKRNLTRENIIQLYRAAHPGIASVVIFEMVPQYEIEQLIQDIDFFKLIQKCYVIMTSEDYFNVDDLILTAAPEARFIIQVLISEIKFPQ